LAGPKQAREPAHVARTRRHVRGDECRFRDAQFVRVSIDSFAAGGSEELLSELAELEVRGGFFFCYFLFYGHGVVGPDAEQLPNPP